MEETQKEVEFSVPEKWDWEENQMWERDRNGSGFKLENTQKKKREQALNEWAETYVFTRHIFSESLQGSWYGLSLTQLNPLSV